MKKMNTISRFFLFIISILPNVILFAQEKATDLNIDIDKGNDMNSNWLSNPLVWVIGALILILIVALIARGGGKKS